jgi:hypothetical protein
MANLLESSQSQATTAPDYYNTYLSGLATSGANAATGAKYVGADPLQTQAFTDVTKVPASYQPTLTDAGNTLTSATNAASPLSSATPYLTAASTDPSKLASQYMNPYITNVVNSLGEAGQRNIMNNLAPQATAGAVGAGQFGSLRGAQVLGQTISNADRDILNAQGQALSTGYGQALTAAGQQNALQAQMGSTAANAASQGQQNLTTAGQAQGTLAGQQQNMSLADINALSTLGAQKQTIEQNKELFPLQNLKTQSELLRGYNVPTTTKTTAQMSPLSAIAGVATGTAGFFTPQYNSAGIEIKGSKPYDSLVGGLQNAYKQWTTPSVSEAAVINPNQVPAGYTLSSDRTYMTDAEGTRYTVGANGQPVPMGSTESGGSDTVIGGGVIGGGGSDTVTGGGGNDIVTGGGGDETVEDGGGNLDDIEFDPDIDSLID